MCYVPGWEKIGEIHRGKVTGEIPPWVISAHHKIYQKGLRAQEIRGKRFLVRGQRFVYRLSYFGQSAEHTIIERRLRLPSGKPAHNVTRGAL